MRIPITELNDLKEIKDMNISLGRIFPFIDDHPPIRIVNTIQRADGTSLAITMWFDGVTKTLTRTLYEEKTKDRKIKYSLDYAEENGQRTSMIQREYDENENLTKSTVFEYFVPNNPFKPAVKKETEYDKNGKIIKVKHTTSEKKSSDIPPWIKNNAKWWAEGKITKDDFLGGIQYLASNGLISTSSCDDTLWDYVYNPSRLKIVNDCTSASGIISTIRVEADGDYHIGLTVDSQYQNLINDENIQNQHGNLVLEVICQKPVTQDSAIEACSNYSGHVDIPNIGDHVIVTGSYVLDLQHGGWAEIHPVSKFEKIPIITK